MAFGRIIMLVAAQASAAIIARAFLTVMLTAMLPGQTTGQGLSQ